ncbi:MAG: hypothetical protein ABL958_10895, partial [Bdellovibrionia bacterium]
MIEKRTPLLDKNIVLLDKYKAADTEACRLGLEFLRSLGFYISTTRSRMHEVVEKYDAVVWESHQLDLRSDLPMSRSKTHVYSLLHQAMHTLVGQCFGSETRNRPKISMLSEGLAGTIDLYFEFASMRKNGGASFSYNQVILQNSRILKRPV